MLLKSRTGIMRCRNQPVLLIYNTHSLKQQDCLRRQDNRGKMILATLICKDHSYSFDLDLITVSQSCCSLSSFPDTAKIFKPFPSGKRFLDLSYCALWHHKREPERSISFWSPQDSLFHKMLKYNCCANKKKKKTSTIWIHSVRPNHYLHFATQSSMATTRQQSDACVLENFKSKASLLITCPLPPSVFCSCLFRRDVKLLSFPEPKAQHSL